jgi:teichuronic acid biosynthesis glycosyltransferase TuaC
MKKPQTIAVSSLFPNRRTPSHGVFLEHRLKHLAQRADIDVKIIVPVPWFPFRAKAFGKYAHFAGISSTDSSQGLNIFYVRYFTLPKLGMYVAPITMAYAIWRQIRKLSKSGYNADLIDAYYLYPDGVAATIAGNTLRLPVILTAFGSDISQLPNFAIPKKAILWAAQNATAITAVCHALKKRMEEIGIDRKKLHVVEHGVDGQLFHPSPNRSAERARLGFDGPTIISIGHLIKTKGHAHIIQAMTKIEAVNLIIIGKGPLEAELKALAEKLGLKDRVRFTGYLSQCEISAYLAASDGLVLCSDREGIANVILEALACGTPVAATAVWGTPEVIRDDRLGLLMHSQDEAHVAETILTLIKTKWDRDYIRQFAEKYSWAKTASDHVEIINKTIFEGQPKYNRLGA